ncbi:Fic family protein [Candidatus Peregrinibacteria bacterium]|nr:Fic family protein [Candidatus Peregrinibacteria bacterium]
MFNPHYTISPKLLGNVKRISTLIFELNGKNFSKVILAELEKKAREISAHASTSIEGNPLPLAEVRKILKIHPKYIRDSEREVLNYNSALVSLHERAKKKNMSFGLPLILDMQKTVTKGLLPAFRNGKMRKEPVFVNDPKSRKTVYWPPDHQDVPALLKELLAFTNRNTTILDPLIIAGIFHKQFVIIHPFMDGNGRTVRLATKVLLAGVGLDTFNLFSFENYYHQNVSDYFKHVGVIGNYYDIFENVDFTPWLEYFTDGMIDELLRVSKILQTASIRPETILQPHHQSILDSIKKKGFITDKMYSTLTKRAKPTRNQDFNKLIDLSLIERLGKGKATIYKRKEP